MLLVPRSLRRAGMTGDVPYYGGRFTPSQAYAAAHRPTQVGDVPPPSVPTRVPVGAAETQTGQQEAAAALQRLLDTGVITDEEYEQLRGRVSP